MKKQTTLVLSVLTALLAVLSFTVACDSRKEYIEEQAERMPTPSEGESGQPTTESPMDELAERTAEQMGVADENEHDEEHGAEGGDNHQHDHMEQTLEEGEYDPSDVVRQPGAEVGDIAQCPVSGEVFTVTADHSYFDTEEGRVYFCCPNCIRRFQRDPQKHLDTQDIAPAPAQE